MDALPDPTTPVTPLVCAECHRADREGHDRGWRADLDGGTLRVEQQLVDRGAGTLAEPKSARSRRMVALDGETVAALRRHRDVQLLERELAGDAYDDLDLVFADPLGRPLSPKRVTEAFARHRAAAGIPSGSLHVCGIPTRRSR